MANIGSFKKSGNEYQGEIVTLSVQAKGVRIVPEPTGPTTTLPATGSSSAAPRLGPPGRSSRRRAADYLSLKLDDPSFTAPIFANLFDDPDGEGYTLIWSRSRKKNGE